MKRLYAVLPLLLLAVAGCGTAGSGGVGADDTTSIELKGIWVVSDISENGTPATRSRAHRFSWSSMTANCGSPQVATP